jgi:hypothetical protein
MTLSSAEIPVFLKTQQYFNRTDKNMATQRYTVTPHPIETLLTWDQERLRFLKFSAPSCGARQRSETCLTRFIVLPGWLSHRMAQPHNKAEGRFPGEWQAYSD